MPTESALQRYVFDGGIMMVGLVPLAFLTIAFAVQGFINLRRARVCPRNYTQALTALIANRTRKDIAAILDAQGHSLALILGRVLRHLEFNSEADPAEVLRDEIEDECALLRQRNNQLAVIYNVAPMMGLLGTVFGMITTFRKFSSTTDPSIQQLGGGIFIALITTAWGLSIAIPAYFFLYFFSKRINIYEQIILPREGAPALHAILRAIGFESASVSGIQPRIGRE